MILYPALQRLLLFPVTDIWGVTEWGVTVLNTSSPQIGFSSWFLSSTLRYK
jgi:hypothetical protein